MTLEPFKEHMLLRASAGTGKTFQLVEAYVDLIKKDKLRPTQIVAITFTKKAAEELRSRIRKRLAHEKIGHQVLQELDRCPIGTFHSLAMQWLQQYGNRMGFASNLRPMEQSGQDEQLFIDACHIAWFSQGTNFANSISRLAPHFELASMLPKSLWHAICLAREDNRSIDTDLVATPKNTYAQWIDLNRHLKLQLTQLVSALSIATLTDRRQALYKKLQDFVPPSIVAQTTYDNLCLNDWVRHIDAWRDTWLFAVALFSDFNSRKKGETPLFPIAEREKLKQAIRVFRAEALLERLSPDLSDLVTSAYRCYTEQKQALGVCDFVDLIAFFNQCLDNFDIHQDVRQRFKAVLVDEAQDTNALQRQMIDKLVGLSGPACSTSRPAHLCVVGDGKQSIYTFRGADPASFSAFSEAIVSLAGKTATLATSYRSTPPLIQAINQLGIHLFGASEYDALQAPKPYPTPTYPDPAVTWLKTQDGATLEQEATRIAQWIGTRLNQGDAPCDFAILLRGLTRAHLFSRALQKANIPVCLLGGHDFYAQSEIQDHLALLTWLVKKQDVLAACAALRSPIFGISDSVLWMLQNHPDQARAGIDALRQGQWDAAIFVQNEHEHALISQENIDHLTHVSRSLCVCVDAIRHTTAHQILTLLDAMFDIHATYLGLEHGEQNVANLQKLWMLAQDHAQEFGADVGHFVWQQILRQRAEVRESLENVPASQTGAVGIGSIHQSKGLQYPIVIMPQLNSLGKGHASKVRYDREQGLIFQNELSSKEKSGTGAWLDAKEKNDLRDIEERKRLFYVAMTRAERELVFVASDLAKPKSLSFADFFKSWQESPESKPWLQIVNLVQPPADQPSFSIKTDAKTPRAWAKARLSTSTHLHINATTLVHADTSPLLDELDSPTEATSSPLSKVAFDATSPKTQGMLMHALLAEIGSISTFGSLDNFIDQTLNRFGYSAADSRLNTLRADAKSFLQSALGAHITSLPQSSRRHELPFQIFCRRLGYPITLHGQLDLLYEDEDTLVIVDFKYAYPGNKQLLYQRQLDVYAWAMSELCRYPKPIRCLLLYLRGGECIPIEHWACEKRQEAVFDLLDDYVRHRFEHLDKEQGYGIDLEKIKTSRI